MFHCAPFKLRGRRAVILAAFGAASTMAFGGAVIAPTVAHAEATSPDAPVSTQAPQLAGSVVQGSVITLTPGTFSNETSENDTWYQCPSAASTKCTATSNTGNTYTSGASDLVGGYVRQDEVATNSSGSNTVWSNAVGPITAGSAASSGAPVVTVSGNTLSWTAVAGVDSYQIATILNPTTTRDTTYQNVTGTSFTPPVVAGQTVNYGVQANVSGGGAPWAKEATITYPAAASSPMLVGLNESGYGANGAADVASAFKLDRVDVSTEDPQDLWSQGVAVDALFSGPYNTGGVSAIDPTSWAQNTLSTFESECAGSTTNCPAVEVLNEPYGSWFWGANATSTANEAAYGTLVVDTWTAFHNQYGAASPKILADYGSDDSWWQGVQAAVPNINNYVDGVTVHPYGGTGSVASSALGNRALVTDAHNATGKPLWISEFGWPTAVGQPATGDSLQWTFTQQATNTYNFVTWLQSLGYVAAATDFNYQDYGTNNFYGVETSAGVKKPAWTALSEAANQQPCTVCS